MIINISNNKTKDQQKAFILQLFSLEIFYTIVRTAAFLINLRQVLVFVTTVVMSFLQLFMTYSTIISRMQLP